jgi:aminobenzoyl-glutamate utilization protein A
MVDNAQNIVKASAQIYGVESEMRCVGHAASFKPDIEFSKELYGIAEETDIFDDLVLVANMNASEDCMAFMNRVTQNGGKATNFLFGTELASPHHTPMFDIDEDSLADAAAFLAILAIKYAN